MNTATATTPAAAVKDVYVGAKALREALKTVSENGFAARIFPQTKEGAKDALSGKIVIIDGGEGKSSTVVAIHCYRTKADGSPAITVNGDPFMTVTVGSVGDQLRGSLFTNTKRPEKVDSEGRMTDPDYRLVCNDGTEKVFECGFWKSDAKNGGVKYISGKVGSRPRGTDVPPADTPAAAPAAPAAAPAPADDPFVL